MLPDIDADDRDVGQERVLVSGGDDSEGLVRWVEALQTARQQLVLAYTQEGTLNALKEEGRRRKKE